VHETAEAAGILEASFYTERILDLSAVNYTGKLPISISSYNSKSTVFE
jgi:hypothetical protein